MGPKKSNNDNAKLSVTFSPAGGRDKDGRQAEGAQVNLPLNQASGAPSVVVTAASAAATPTPPRRSAISLSTEAIVRELNDTLLRRRSARGEDSNSVPVADHQLPSTSRGPSLSAPSSSSPEEVARIVRSTQDAELARLLEAKKGDVIGAAALAAGLNLGEDQDQNPTEKADDNANDAVEPMEEEFELPAAEERKIRRAEIQVQRSEEHGRVAAILWPTEERRAFFSRRTGIEEPRASALMRKADFRDDWAEFQRHPTDAAARRLFEAAVRCSILRFRGREGRKRLPEARGETGGDSGDRGSKGGPFKSARYRGTSRGRPAAVPGGAEGAPAPAPEEAGIVRPPPLPPSRSSRQRGSGDRRSRQRGAKPPLLRCSSQGHRKRRGPAGLRAPASPHGP